MTPYWPQANGQIERFDLFILKARAHIKPDRKKLADVFANNATKVQSDSSPGYQRNPGDNVDEARNSYETVKRKTQKIVR